MNNFKIIQPYSILKLISSILHHLMNLQIIMMEINFYLTKIKESSEKSYFTCFNNKTNHDFFFIHKKSHSSYEHPVNIFSPKLVHLDICIISL